MKVIAVLAAALLAAGSAAFGDEFSDPSTLTRWNVSVGEIDDGGQTTWTVAQGQLVVRVARSSWVNNQHAFYLSQPVTGDFTVTARVRASGRRGAVPTGNWSLAGLLVRDPLEAGTNEEAWIGWTTGRVDGRPVFERKTTEQGVSQLELVAAKWGWIQLRIVRSGSAFTLYRRYPGKRWIRQWRYDRADLGETLQVGIDAQTGFRSRADLVAHVDWIRFS